MINTIIQEMIRGNFSFLILVIGTLQLIVMIRGQWKRKRKVRNVTSQVYENIKNLNYGELLSSIDRMRNKIYEMGDEVNHADFMYYIALVQELDNRQKEEE